MLVGWRKRRTPTIKKRSSLTGDEDHSAWNSLHYVHLWPLDGMVSPGPLGSSKLQGRFILGAASHLDAFSGYLRLPSLPGAAVGTTAGTREGNSTRSSRTRVHAPQSSNAHDGYRPNCLTTF